MDPMSDMLVVTGRVMLRRSRPRPKGHDGCYQATLAAHHSLQHAEYLLLRVFFSSRKLLTTARVSDD